VTEAIVPGAEPFRFDRADDGVLMVHGFSGSPASLRPMGEWFAEQGVSVLGVRLPGHGTTLEDLARRPWIEWSAEVAHGLQDIRTRCTRVLVLAQSFGAALAVRLAAERPREVDALALLNPYLFDARLLILPIARHVKRTAKPVGDDIARPGVTEIAYPQLPVPAVVQMAEVQRLARRDLPRVTAPALVFRSTRDHVIPRSNARRVFDALGSARKRLVECPRSYHVVSLDHDAPMVRARALELLRSV
jgi:carboxylesterase